MATTFMALDLPTVSVTTGPEWATALNNAFETVDSHDHSAGKGTKVPTSGINVNLDFSFNSFKAKDLKSTQFTLQPTALTGNANALSVYAYQNNLYYTNAAGTAVQITNGSTLATSTISVNAQAFTFASINTDTTISPSSDNVFLAVDTTVPRSITLPLASAVATGRIYMVKDFSGLSETNNITISPSGSDTIDSEASILLRSNYGTICLISNGAASPNGQWSIY